MIEILIAIALGFGAAMTHWSWNAINKRKSIRGWERLVLYIAAALLHMLWVVTYPIGVCVFLYLSYKEVKNVNKYRLDKAV